MSARMLGSLHFHRVLAGAEHRHILKTGLATVVDVGANRGQFALAARRWASKAYIISFEPLAEAASSFRKVFQGDLKVTFHQAAPLQERLFPGTGEIQTEMVKIGPLSDYVMPEEIVSPALLKLDVQGYELEALRGCEDLLNRFSHVYAECSFVELYSGQALVDDIVAWLRERGWCLSGIHNMIYDRQGRSIQADFLFENSCFTSST
ncbi:MAG: FkbM family methyltransferase [Desulfosarcina sp.]|nr:FkbM family methyltransferase [Desulfosarcina sp.]